MPVKSRLGTRRPIWSGCIKIEDVVNIFASVEGATFDDYKDLVDDLYTILNI